jgi:hypothetical protein
MDGFYTTVLSIASIILILLLTYVGILLYYAKSDEVYPPYQKPCPDYWDIDASGNCIYPPTTSERNRGGLVARSGQPAGMINPAAAASTATPGVIQYQQSPSVAAAINFNDAGWKTIYNKKNELCNKKYWADAYNVEWDGVRNTNQC